MKIHSASYTHKRQYKHEGKKEAKNKTNKKVNKTQDCSRHQRMGSMKKKNLKISLENVVAAISNHITQLRVGRKPTDFYEPAENCFYVY